MPNVLLTQRCVRSCPYCFARKHMADTAPDDMLSWENLIYIADFLQASGERHVSLLGGEPLLHPEFADMVCYLLARPFNVTVFTSGISSDATLDRLQEAFETVRPDQLSLVCNVNEPADGPPAEVRRVERFLSVMGRWTGLGFNIYRPDFSLDFIVDLVSRFNLKRSIRLGLAHPIPGRPNRHVSLPDIDAVIARLREQLPMLERFRMVPGLDCGFPLCRFRDDDLGRLFKASRNSIRFHCAPVIDIGPDMTVWNCFPLSSFHKRSLFDFDSLAEVTAFFGDLNRKIRMEVAGLYEECDECVHREDGLCHGGCLAHSLSRFAEEPPIRIPEMAS